MALVWLILILIIVLVIIAFVLLIKQLVQSLNSSANTGMARKMEVFAKFSYTDEEWEYVEQKEFVEDDRGKGFFDKYSGVISYNQYAQENSQREIFFSAQTIYITDGKKGKSFTVNKLNSFGNGFRLNSMDLLHLSPLKKLRIKIRGIGISPESNELDFDLDYLIPMPQSAVEKIDEILKTYGDIILND